MPWDYLYWTEILGSVVTEFTSWFPAIAAALALVIVGWIAAGLSRAILALLLRRLGFDKLAEREGVTRALSEIGVVSLPADFVSRIAHWLILVVIQINTEPQPALIGTAGSAKFSRHATVDKGKTIQFIITYSGDELCEKTR
jgi:hypothetical protein